MPIDENRWKYPTGRLGEGGVRRHRSFAEEFDRMLIFGFVDDDEELTRKLCADYLYSDQTPVLSEPSEEEKEILDDLCFFDEEESEDENKHAKKNQSEPALDKEFAQKLERELQKMSFAEIEKKYDDLVNRYIRSSYLYTQLVDLRRKHQAWLEKLIADHVINKPVREVKKVSEAEKGDRIRFFTLGYQAVYRVIDIVELEGERYYLLSKGSSEQSDYYRYLISEGEVERLSPIKDPVLLKLLETIRSQK